MNRVALNYLIPQAPMAQVETPANPHMILIDVVQKLSLAKDLETIMFIVRTAARKLTGADGATFVLRDQDQCFYADEDAIAPLWKGKRFPMSVCVSGWVMQNKKAVVIDDIYSDVRVPIDAYRITFVKSLAMVPIRTYSPVGAIGTYWANFYKPTEEQVNILKALADSTSVAMENLKLQSEVEQSSKTTNTQIQMTQKLMESNKDLQTTLDELNQRNQEMKLLKEFSANLQSCFHLEEAYQLIARAIPKILPNVSGALYFLNSSGNYLEAMITLGNANIAEKFIKKEDCFALRRSTVYQSAQQDLICPHGKTHSVDFICIPLMAQNEIVGLISLEWPYEKNSNEDILLSMLTEPIALSIYNIKLRETLRNQSLQDTLTGLHNRRYLEENFARIMNFCAQNSKPLSVLMIDIDHFKLFNDQYGHKAGDIVLQALAGVMKNNVNENDIACRLGGEEFFMVLPNTTVEVAEQYAKKLHEMIDQLHLHFHQTELPKITISIGVASFPKDAITTQDLMHEADTALYQAKNAGRNKTVVFKRAN